MIFNTFLNILSLKVNENEETGTKIFTCPSTSEVDDPVYQMFYGTSGSFMDMEPTGTPNAGNTYYYY